MTRGRRSHVLIGALLLGASSLGRPAHAAPDDAERAKELYALGAEAFAAQRNADAISYFQRAAELVPSAKLTYNIGLAYEEMGDTGRALRQYRDYLRQEPDGGTRQEVEARIAMLEQRLLTTGLQQLSVTSEPAGAVVRIGGRAVGLTPWAGELTPGPHEVELTLAGHSSERARVELAPERSSELALKLAPEPERAASEGSPSRWSRVSPLTWTFLGVGAAAVTGGVVFELSRQSSSDEASRADTPLAAAEARGAADAKQMASLLLLGFGGGFLVGGGVLLALDLSEAGTSAGSPAPGTSPASAATLACQPAFCGLLAHGRF
jgi:tetratricopeptide (TPR) repeat protein